MLKIHFLFHKQNIPFLLYHTLLVQHFSLSFIILHSSQNSIEPSTFKNTHSRRSNEFLKELRHDKKPKNKDTLFRDLQEVVRKPSLLDLDKFQAGLDAMEMGDSNTAIKEFRKYVTCTRIQGKKWQKGQRETLIASLRNIAILLMNQKNYVDAILELNAAINLEKLSPSKVDSKLLRAECLIELQDFGKAKLDLAEAVEIVTIGNVACDINKMYYLMGLCLFKEGNSLHKAISSLNLALQSHSHAFDLHIYKLLGEIHIKLKDYEQAQTCFTKAIQIVEKNCTEHVLLLGCEFLTDLYMGRSHARKEMQEFEKALEDCEVLTKLISEGSNSKPLDMDANTITLIQKQKEEILSQMDEDSTPPTLKKG